MLLMHSDQRLQQSRGTCCGLCVSCRCQCLSKCCSRPTSNSRSQSTAERAREIEGWCFLQPTANEQGSRNCHWQGSQTLQRWKLRPWRLQASAGWDFQPNSGERIQRYKPTSTETYRGLTEFISVIKISWLMCRSPVCLDSMNHCVGARSRQEGRVFVSFCKVLFFKEFRDQVYSMLRRIIQIVILFQQGILLERGTVPYNLPFNFDSTL